MLNNYRERVENIFHINSIGRFLINRGLSPNMLTIAGAIGTVISSILCIVVKENFIYATILIGFFSSFDMLDGTIARISNTVTRTGKVLDSVLDRVCDFIIFFSLILNVIKSYFTVILLGLALLTAYIVSYLRSCGEAVGISMKRQKVFFERGDRMMCLLVSFLIIGLGISKTIILPIVAVLIASSSMVTIVQRSKFIYLAFRKKLNECEEIY